eukprot:332763-Chlamydomonas_euryale.AAC.4
MPASTLFFAREPTCGCNSTLTLGVVRNGRAAQPNQGRSCMCCCLLLGAIMQVKNSQLFQRHAQQLRHHGEAPSLIVRLLAIPAVVSAPQLILALGYTRHVHVVVEADVAAVSAWKGCASAVTKLLQLPGSYR